MAYKVRKILKRIILIIIFIIVGIFSANWYLSYRLEDNLRKHLNNKVAEASDGFYTLSFDKVRVNIFTGELLLKNLELTPDSAIFDNWQSKDSLPQTYFRVKLASIEFNGINLIWRLNYKKLDFSLFEIKDPQVWITTNNTSSSTVLEEDNLHLQSKSLYELVEPYINTLRARRINFLNGSLTYHVEDSINPTTYSLQGINFHAFGFALDSTCLHSHKLLYCDNFEFSTNRPQTLLSDTYLKVDMGSILFNTRDSIIRFDGIQVHSLLDSVKTERLFKPGNYVDATVGTVVLKGINIREKGNLRCFDAKSFEILDSDISCIAIKPKIAFHEEDVADINKDTITFTLYDLISPVFHRVSVDRITIQKAKLRYTVKDQQNTDCFYLDKFDFLANNFLVDSLAIYRDRFWYSEEYMLKASDVRGMMATNNYDVTVGHFRIDTKERILHIADINVNPISLELGVDYILGHIEAVDLMGLKYNKGVTADSLVIKAPQITYSRQTTSGKEHPKSIEAKGSKPDISPYLEYLKIKDTWIRNGNVIYKDDTSEQSYAVNNVNLNLTDLSMDQLILSNPKHHFRYEDYDLQFSHFENLLPSKDYRLVIDNFKMSSFCNEILMDGVSLIPEKDSLQTRSHIYDLTIPHLLLSWTDINLAPAYRLNVNSLALYSPQLTIQKSKNDSIKLAKENAPSDLKKIVNQLDWLTISSLDLVDAEIKYVDKYQLNTFDSEFNRFALQGVEWSGNNKMQIRNILINSPHISLSDVNNRVKRNNLSSLDSVDKPFHLNGILDTLMIGRISVDDFYLDITDQDKKIINQVEHLAISNLQWASKSLFKISELTVLSPKIDFHRNYKLDKIVTDTIPNKQSNDFYSSISRYTDSVSIDHLKVSDAQINYTYDLDDKESKPKFVGTANVSIKDYAIDTKHRQMHLSDYVLNANNIRFPISKGFYTVELGDITATKKNNRLVLDRLHLIPFYPKEEFAYKEPKHKDWFDVSIGNITLDNIDVSKYLKDKILDVDTLIVRDVLLQNYKNQNIAIEHRPMPMIYDKLYTLPFRFNVKDTKVSNFSVVYEELSKGAKIPGKILFTDMNGSIPNFTNMPIDLNQYIKLDANGKFMGTGNFTATWAIPASSQNNHFSLDGHLSSFQLTALNQLITPMAPLEVRSGNLTDLKFSISASSEGGSTEMLFLYNDLGVSVFNNNDSSTNKLYTILANTILRENNPNRPNRKPRKVYTTIVRDKEHSTFNYFWQLLQPAVVGSVGISQRRQNFLKKATGLIYEIKRFIRREEDVFQQKYEEVESELDR